MELWRGPELPWVLTEEKALLPSASLYRSAPPSVGEFGSSWNPSYSWAACGRCWEGRQRASFSSTAPTGNSGSVCGSRLQIL